MRRGSLERVAGASQDLADTAHEDFPPERTPRRFLRKVVTGVCAEVCFARCFSRFYTAIFPFDGQLFTG